MYIGEFHMQYIDGLDKSVGLWRTLDRFISIADKYISKYIILLTVHLSIDNILVYML